MVKRKWRTCKRAANPKIEDLPDFPRRVLQQYRCIFAGIVLYRHAAGDFYQAQYMFSRW